MKKSQSFRQYNTTVLQFTMFPNPKEGSHAHSHL
jgi:hypothetical protein